MKKAVEHLIMIGIIVALWVFAMAMDRVLSKGVISAIMIFGSIGYTIFALIIGLKRDKKDPIRIYILLGAFSLCISLLMSMK